MMVFLRCFAYGLEPGQSFTADIDGTQVAFSYDSAQQDAPVTAPIVDPQPVTPNDGN